MRNSKHVTVNSRYTEKETKTMEQDRDTVVQETTEGRGTHEWAFWDVYIQHALEYFFK